MKACVIIPARFKSTRLPGKPLIKILGIPMIIRVADIAAKAVGKENVFIATEDERISSTVVKKGYKYIMTSNSALTGTDRVAEASKKVIYDIYINVQGDEPLIDFKDIIKCINLKKKYPDFIINAFNKVEDEINAKSINVPKVITNESGDLVYISRSLIPGFKDDKCKPKIYKKQVCIYGFTGIELKKFLDYGRKSQLEYNEDIEILRFLELGIKVKMFESQRKSVAVDVKSDISIVEEILQSNKNK